MEEDRHQGTSTYLEWMTMQLNCDVQRREGAEGHEVGSNEVSHVSKMRAQREKFHLVHRKSVVHTSFPPPR